MKYFSSRKFLTFFPILIILILTLSFFKDFIIRGKIYIPADTIVGLYHPWRDVVWDNFTQGVPFKNFLITDPVRQQYPWKNLVITDLKQGILPVWNPYNFAGTPLLANFQSAVYYPLNLLFFIFQFNIAWQILIMAQILLGLFFMYLFLQNRKVSHTAALFGAICFAFSGFFMSWLEWGTVVQTALWLPFILFTIDKIFLSETSKSLFIWSAALFASFTFSFFAGHLQTFFYVFLVTFIYSIYSLRLNRQVNQKNYLALATPILLFAVVSLIQALPTWEFIRLSARQLDQADWRVAGWFLPWQNLVQFIAPDFFGNPATLNYWGIFNYGEFIGYIGIIPLIFVFYGLFRPIGKNVWFFFVFALVSLSFALPTPWSAVPYLLKIPLLSTSQPTRLMFIVDFCLSVLAAFGFESFLQKQKKLIPLVIVSGLLVGLGIYTVIGPKLNLFNIQSADALIARHNLYLPALLLILGIVAIVCYLFTGISRRIVAPAIILLLIVDLFRFGWKYNPSVVQDWIFPSTQTIAFLKSDPEIFRIAATDSRIFPPNFSSVYRIQTVSGYDPIYLQNYGELIAATERNKPDIQPPFGFNRIITPTRYESLIFDLLNVKYILSLEELTSSKLKLVFREGETRIYQNEKVLPRAFLTDKNLVAGSNQEAIDMMFDPEVDLADTVVNSENINIPNLPLNGNENASIISYQDNRVEIITKTDVSRMLVLTDNYYPGWHVTIDGKIDHIYKVDYSFRGVVCPPGEHHLVFQI
jgi:hypothetical protein